MKTSGWIVCGALLASGCAQNAVLELLLTLPPAPPPDGLDLRWYGVVDIYRATETGFSTEREIAGNRPIPRELGAVPQVDCISVQTLDPTMDLEIRVRFCRDVDCLEFPHDVDAPVHYVRLEHPFYVGQRTYWHEEITRVPECTLDSDCTVGRCIDGRCGCSSDADCCAGGCACPTDTDPLGGTCYACEDGTDSETDEAERVPDSCVARISRCSIEGCVSGRGATGFCSSSEGMPHFCEVGNGTVAAGDYPLACTPDPS